ncbi:DUF4383 domain-containing protein [Phytoactinopolyspora halotolerans]|uniref:DUF4383 domain-containing protein n=1 Tax=Phytoactinopolyspora halotolerans TaxID=1981512 RepID=A0A6L9SD86_9ACTN|nr:DUF4383 domain-containing protein [Phytoactinopolyspora halotolerans]
MAPAPEVPDGPSPVSSPVRTAAYLVAVVFLLVGVAGFIPGITTDYDMMEFAGPDSEAMLFGVFAVSVLHNIVHLLFGIVGLLLARTVRLARTYLIAGGLVYLALFIFGIVIDQDEDVNFVPVNDADNWLHLGLAAGMVLLGLLPGSQSGRQVPRGS